MGKVYPEDIINLSIVNQTADFHRQDPENFYPELNMEMMFEFLNVIRRRIGTVMTDRAVIVHPSNVELFAEEEVVHDYFSETDSTADDKQRGYYGQFSGCPIVASSDIPQDLIACAQLYPDSGQYNIVALNTSFIGQYVPQEETEIPAE